MTERGFESDEALSTARSGRTSRNLHWFIAAGLGAVVLIGFGIQSSLKARAAAAVPVAGNAEDNPVVMGREPPLNILREVLVQNMGSAEAALQKLLRSASDGSAFLASIAFTLLLVPVVFFYLLKDWSNIVQSLFSAVPIRHRALVSSVTGEIDSVLGQFLRGQLIVMLVMSVYYATALHVVGLDSGIPIGILTGCLVFIPYVGVFTGFVLAILTALVQGPGITLLLPVTIAFVLGHVLEGTVITPRLVGERIGLHPVMVIFSLLAFGKLLGFFGILIALPTTAALWIIIRRVNQTMSSESEIR